MYIVQWQCVRLQNCLKAAKSVLCEIITFKGLSCVWYFSKVLIIFIAASKVLKWIYSATQDFSVNTICITAFWLCCFMCVSFLFARVCFCISKCDLTNSSKQLKRWDEWIKWFYLLQLFLAPQNMFKKIMTFTAML